MKKPVNTSMVPNGGWAVEIEDCGPKIVSHNYVEFIQTVMSRMRANGLDKHGWKEYALDLMCQQNPAIPCDDDEKLPSRAVTGDDLQRFVRTIWEAWMAGAKPVSEEEQDRRAAICGACPKKGYVSCFGGCGALAEKLSQMTIGSKGKGRPELHKMGCQACGCELSSLIMYPLDVLRAVDEKIGFQPEEYDPKCWKIEKSE